MHGMSSKVPKEQTNLFINFAQHVLELQLVKEQPTSSKPGPHQSLPVVEPKSGMSGTTNQELQNLEKESEKFVESDEEANTNLDSVQSTQKKEVKAPVPNPVPIDPILNPK